MGPTGNMQGSYYFLDLDTKALIKRRRFAELPVPDSVIRSVERWGKRDKQNGMLRFCDRNNDPFEWSDEQQPLIEDNTPEPEPATYPDVPAETPGVVLEANVQAVATPPPLSDQERMAAALENAGIVGEFKEFQYKENGGTNKQHHEPDVHVTQNHFTIIQAKDGEVEAPQDEEYDRDDEVPALEITEEGES
jgi:hypothetical protein